MLDAGGDRAARRRGRGGPGPPRAGTQGDGSRGKPAGDGHLLRSPERRRDHRARTRVAARRDAGRRPSRGLRGPRDRGEPGVRLPDRAGPGRDVDGGGARRLPGPLSGHPERHRRRRVRGHRHRPCPRPGGLPAEVGRHHRAGAAARRWGDPGLRPAAEPFRPTRRRCSAEPPRRYGRPERRHPASSCSHPSRLRRRSVGSAYFVLATQTPSQSLAGGSARSSRARRRYKRTGPSSGAATASASKSSVASAHRRPRYSATPSS